MISIPIISSGEIIMEIYYNPEQNNNNNPYKKNEDELKRYIAEYNSRNSTVHTYESISQTLDYIKKYEGKLYETEYQREGELEYLKDFCDIYESKIENAKDGTIIRLLSFNVHCFIKSCKLKDTQLSYSNHEDVIDLIKKNNPDIVALQEYSPVYLNNYDLLDIKNFPEHIKSNTSLINYIISNGHDNPKLLHNYLGNLIMTKFDINSDDYLLHTFQDKNNNYRVFLGFKTNILGIDVIIFNIHPVAEYGNYEPEKSANFNQIKTFIYNINLLYPPNLNNIIICGDYNNHHTYLKKFMNDNFYVSVHDFYDINNNNFTGYHGSYLDFIYVSNSFLYYFDIVNLSVIYVNYSDHYPVLFDFRKKSNIIKDSINSTIDWYKYSINNIFSYGLDRVFEISKDAFIKALNRYIEHELFDLNNIKEILGCDIITIPKDTYLCHGTDKDNFEIHVELDALNNNKTLSEVPKSFTFLYFPFESFMSWYGINTECSKNRFLIYKLKSDIKVINLLKDIRPLNERIIYRFKSYFKLYDYFRKYYKFLPEIKYSTNKLIAFDIMRILWILINNQLLSNINFEDKKYNPNMFYGIILYDTIENDFAFFKKNIDHSNVVEYGNNREWMSGIEIQLFIHNFFTEIVGVYYNNQFYKIDEWKLEFLQINHKINQNISNANQNTDLNRRDESKLPNELQMNRIIKRNLVNLYNFIIQLIIDENYKKNMIIIEQIFKNILSYEYYKLDTVDKNIPFTIKLILNEFISMIVNIIYYKPNNIGDDMCSTETKWDELDIFPQREFKYDELYNSFRYYIQSNHSGEEFNDPNIKYIKDTLIQFITNVKKTRIYDLPLLYLDKVTSHTSSSGTGRIIELGGINLVF